MTRVKKGLIALCGLTLAGLFAVSVSVSARDRSTEFPAPRNPDTAVQEQYDAAVARGTKSAYTLFIQRYPHHTLANKMRQLMRKNGMKTP